MLRFGHLVIHDIFVQLQKSRCLLQYLFRLMLRYPLHRMLRYLLLYLLLFVIRKSHPSHSLRQIIDSEIITYLFKILERRTTVGVFLLELLEL
ncbi:hypothetical protein PFISCL1PPCAC_16874, partial [Pristionchus fissidentatus]